MPLDAKFLKRLQDAAEALARLERGEVPGDIELAAAPQLDCWYRTDRHNFRALGGIVTGHPLLADGSQITTSVLLLVADAKRGARTGSRLYRLGTSMEDLRATRQGPPGARKGVVLGTRGTIR